MLRFFNSVLAAACVALLLLHILWAAALLAGLTGYSNYISLIGWIFLTCLTLHGLLSLYLFALHDRPECRFPYPRSNSGALVQRLSGAALIALVIPHINEAYGHVTLSGWFLPNEPTAGRYILEASLLAAVGMHLWHSLPRLTVSLGLLQSEEGLVRWKKAFRLALAAVALLVLAALTKYFFFG